MQRPLKHQIAPFLRQIFTLGNIFLGCGMILLGYNFYRSTQATLRTVEIRKKVPYWFLGQRFEGLKEFLTDARYLGYYTDKNLDNNLDAREYAQAQYTLAPIILDENYTKHRYILFNCVSPLTAIQKINELGAKPVKMNNLGTILAENPNPRP